MYIWQLKYILLGLLLSVLCTTFGFAEYYKWVDQDGVTHYTDDISKIPKEQRPGIDVYTSIETDEQKIPEQKESDKNIITLETLAVKKQALNKEYNDFLKRREVLLEQKKSIGEVKYNKLAKKLNIAIQEYQKKFKAYEALVEQYNEQIKTLGNSE